MQSILDRVNDLNDLILQGKFLHALEKHYHPDVVMQDNNLPPCIGKAANIEREKAMLGAVTEFKAAEVLKVATGDNLSMVEWYFHFLTRDGGEVNHKQVAVQVWKEGQIINEHFYYFE